MKFQQLETARLLLRKFDDNDLNFIFKHFQDEFVSKFLYDNKPPKNIEEAKAILNWCFHQENANHIRWCIVFKQNRKSIGTIGFHRFDQINHSAEIGYDLAETYTRQGIMTEALECILDFGFSEGNLHRIYAHVAVENTASNLLLKKNGFILEGVIRDQFFFRGKYYNHNLWSILSA